MALARRSGQRLHQATGWIEKHGSIATDDITGIRGFDMHHRSDIAAASGQRHSLSIPPTNLGGLVREQVQAIVADGFSDIDIRWNSIVLSIEAQSDDGFVRRVFNCSGACVMEKIDRGGCGVERYYDSDGITLLSEEIFETGANR
mgnify:CR=1 FL=1